MEMVRRDHCSRHDDESTALLPQGGHGYAAIAVEEERGPGPGLGRQQWGRSWLQLASLVALGVAVAMTVAAMTIAYSSAQDSQPNSQRATPQSLINGNNADVLRDEASISTPTPSPLDASKDERTSASRGGEGVEKQSEHAVVEEEEKEEEKEKEEEEEEEEEQEEQEEQDEQEPEKEDGEENGEATPPNVIFILIDDVGMNDFGPSSTDISLATPFMDSLAKEGVQISRYYTNHICTPARVSRSLSL